MLAEETIFSISASLPIFQAPKLSPISQLRSIASIAYPSALLPDLSRGLRPANAVSGRARPPRSAPMKLSVLDQSPVRAGASAAEAVRETIALARHVDRLGYHRYWLAEHHGSPGLASTAPEILIARVAAETRFLRVGSGGVMLSHYSPLKVAEQFRMLEVLYPGRIDLGVGRAPGSDGRTAQVLAYGRTLGVEHFPEQLMDLYGFLSDDFPAAHPFHGIRAMPATTAMPELW